MLLTNAGKVVALALGVLEARRPEARDSVIAFCALCFLGGQVVEDILVRVIDRFFGRPPES